MKKNICFFLFLAFTVFLSCKNATENPKQKLLDAFKDQKIDSAWNFETAENDSMKTAAFRNKAIGERIELSSRDTSLVIGFFSRENKLTHSSMLFKSELFRHDSLLYVEITDPSGKQIDKILLPSAKKRVSITAPAQPSITTFGNFDACFYDFNCKQRSQLQCLANETCKPVWADIDCCLPNGQCYAFLVIINPTRLLCSIAVIDFPVIFATE